MAGVVVAFVVDGDEAGEAEQSAHVIPALNRMTACERRHKGSPQQGTNTRGREHTRNAPNLVHSVQIVSVAVPDRQDVLRLPQRHNRTADLVTDIELLANDGQQLANTRTGRRHNDACLAAQPAYAPTPPRSATPAPSSVESSLCHPVRCSHPARAHGASHGHAMQHSDGTTQQRTSHIGLIPCLNRCSSVGCVISFGRTMWL